jgi:hypothetical protein
MVSVRLRNPDIILTPITNEEKIQFEKNFMGEESIYVLYRLPNSEGIHIGMMSSSMRKYFPSTANVWNIDSATSMAFFYNGCSELENNASQITDRPVYRVRPSDDRMVSSYDILNGTPENGLRIRLEDVVDGNYTLNSETPSKSRKLR